MARILVALAALALIALSLLRLEGERSGLAIERERVAGTTPVTLYRQPGSEGPAVVVAHGFAGSRQLMEAYSLTLAQAGYQVASFDFQGHGANRVPMSGDVTAEDGTTAKLVAETRAVVDRAAALAPGSRVALLGHSMASDVIVRTAAADPRIGPVVAISIYSEAVAPSAPRRLLTIVGQFEPHLRDAALGYLRQVAPEAREGETARGGDGVVRRAVTAPWVEHVGVLYSATGLAEARAWLDAAYGRTTPPGRPVAATGGWIAALLLGCVALAWPLARLLPAGAPPRALPRGVFWAAVALPALATPLILRPLETRFLPVLVADYLALHLLVYGALSLAVLAAAGRGPGRLRWPWALAAAALVAYGLGVFGLALDRYAASFMPHSGRWPILVAVACGAVPFMLADATVTEAGHAALWRRLTARAAFFVSTALAVALDLERLFFLVIILPVILLFFLVFGQMGGWAGRRTGAPLVPGLALGVILAWAIGVSFPLFAA